MSDHYHVGHPMSDAEILDRVRRGLPAYVPTDPKPVYQPPYIEFADERAEQRMSTAYSVWDELTPVQAEAVHATANALNLDAGEVALRLVPHLRALPEHADTAPGVLLGKPNGGTNPLTVITPEMIEDDLATGRSTVAILMPQEENNV